MRTVHLLSVWAVLDPLDRRTLVRMRFSVDIYHATAGLRLQLNPGAHHRDFGAALIRAVKSFCPNALFEHGDGPLPERISDS